MSFQPLNGKRPSSLRESLARIVQPHGLRLHSLQEPSGQFRDPEFGYTIYGQYAGYVCASFWKSLSDQNDERPELLLQATAGWDFYATQIRETGKAAIVTFDRFWYDAFDEWGLYYWMETFALIESHLDERKREQWDARIRLIGQNLSTHIVDQMESADFQAALAAGDVANHFVWCLLAIYRYGRHINEPDFCRQARSGMEQVIAAQLPCGAWLEGGSAVVGYGDVTACAISLFAEMDDHAGARQASERHFGYVLGTLYPDFSRNDCIDGRYWYSRKLFPYTAPSYGRFPKGREYLQQWIASFEDFSKVSHFRGISLQGLTTLTGIIPFLSDDAVQPDDAPLFLGSGSTDWPEISSKIQRDQGWVITQCAQLSGRGKGRWIFERQNLVSIFHQDSGLIVGGGHSFAQPEFSCFNLINNGRLTYLHDEYEFASGELRLKYEDTWCTVQCQVLGPSQLTVTYAVERLSENAKVIVNMPLWIPDHDGIMHFNNKRFSLREMAASSLGIPMSGGGILVWRDLSIVVPEDASLRYPIDGYSPYQVDKADDSLNRRQAIIQISLSATKPTCSISLKLDESP